VEGEKMLALATAILQSAHDTLPGGDDEDRWNEYSAVFVSGLVRRAFIQLRDSQARLQHSVYFIMSHGRSWPGEGLTGV